MSNTATETDLPGETLEDLLGWLVAEVRALRAEVANLQRSGPERTGKAVGDAITRATSGARRR